MIKIHLNLNYSLVFFWLLYSWRKKRYILYMNKKNIPLTVSILKFTFYIPQLKLYSKAHWSIHIHREGERAHAEPNNFSIFIFYILIIELTYKKRDFVYFLYYSFGIFKYIYIYIYLDNKNININAKSRLVSHSH